MINLVIAILIVVAVCMLLYIGEKAIKNATDYVAGLEKKCGDLEEANQALIQQIVNERRVNRKIADDNIALIEELDALRERMG